MRSARTLARARWSLRTSAMMGSSSVHCWCRFFTSGAHLHTQPKPIKTKEKHGVVNGKKDWDALLEGVAAVERDEDLVELLQPLEDVRDALLRVLRLGAARLELAGRGSRQPRSATGFTPERSGLARGGFGRGRGFALGDRGVLARRRRRAARLGRARRLPRSLSTDGVARGAVFGSRALVRVRHGLVRGHLAGVVVELHMELAEHLDARLGDLRHDGTRAALGETEQTHASWSPPI